MNLLKRELAPISDSAWQQINDEAKAVFAAHLGGRKLVDFDGPYGWARSAVNTGRLQANVVDLGEGVEGRLRAVMPLIELRVPFALNRAELDAAVRGADDIDLEPLTQAAKKIAAVENQIIFMGIKKPARDGVVSASSHAPITLTDQASDYLQAVVDAEQELRQAGVGGPYGLALGPKAYERIKAATDDGYPVRQSILRILDGPLVWIPAMEGAALVSMRGGDFILTVGQDLSIGYLNHDSESVNLYLTESLAFRVLQPAAAVPFRHA